jgi:predicted PurR-regulated permease PerM
LFKHQQVNPLRHEESPQGRLHRIEPRPMTGCAPPAAKQAPEPWAFERFVQVGLLVLLVVWCFYVVQPFVMPVAWALIIAVSLHPIFQRLQTLLRGRRIPAAALTTLLALTVLVIPVAYLGDTLIVSIEHVGQKLSEDGLEIPSPPAKVAALPVVGPSLDKVWRRVARNESALLTKFEDHLKPLGRWFVSVAAGAGFALAQFIVAIFLAGVVLACKVPLRAHARQLLLRVMPRKGAAIVTLIEATIRNVSRGVLGVAAIQTLCAGVGFLLVGLPAAGLWALLCFILATVQIGVLPVVGPAALYVLFTADMRIAIPFAIGCAFVGLIDNVLKPLLLHHGMSTPLWIIVVGAIGGLLCFGVMGCLLARCCWFSPMSCIAPG